MWRVAASTGQAVENSRQEVALHLGICADCVTKRLHGASDLEEYF